jgi:hypothetical protein
MADGAILIATTSALIPYEGREVCIAGGRTTAREGHPILAGREGLFRVLVPDYEVEQPPAKPEPARKPPPPEPPAKPAPKPAPGASGPPPAPKSDAGADPAGK